MNSKILLLLTICSFSFLSVLKAQKIMSENLELTTTFLPSDAMVDTTIVNQEIPSNSVIIQADDFNKGAISDVALLLQGKIAGLSIYNKGGDPNERSIMQVRGLNTMGPYIQPLIVIDGIVGASLNNIDPNDIASIEVLKDGFSCAKYGMRGSMGVIIIHTKKANINQKKLTYIGQGGTSSSLGTVSVLNAEEYKKAGGTDYGSSTNWIKEITRPGSFSNHHLSGQIFKGKSGLLLSANYRDVQGILKSSGFKQLNLRSNFTTSLLNDKIKVDVSGSYTNRKADIGIRDAIKYAISANPTLPIYGKAAILPFNSALYGGYYENLGLSEAFNPVSIINQSFKRSQNTNLNLNGIIRYQLTQNLSFSSVYGYQNIETNQTAFFPTTAYYKGVTFPTNRGLVESLNEQDKFSFLESSIEYRKKFKTNTLSFQAAYTFQQMRYTSNAKVLSNFNNDFTYSIFEERIDTSLGNTYKETDRNGPKDRIITFFASSTYQIKDFLSFTGSLTRDGSSRLGKNNKWGFFPAVSGKLDMAKLWNMTKTNHFILRSGYGVTGSLPQGFGMSQNYEEIVVTRNSMYNNLRWSENPNLKWEEKRSINVGIEYSKGNISGTLDFYNSTSKDFIVNTFSNNLKFENANSIQTRGIELSLLVKLLNNDKIKYNMGLILSSYKSVLKSFNKKSILSGASYSNYGYILIQEGKELGNIVGPIFEGVSPNGLPIYKDVNNDGAINIQPEYSNQTDLAILGKGTPDLELGWTHQLKIGNWQMNALFRGALGHSMVNINRYLWENELLTTNYNAVKTSKSVDGLKSRFFHSLFVEKADFIKLDNLTITRNIAIKTSSITSKLQLSLTAQNLFVISGYTSGDPEPSLTFENPSSNTLYPSFMRTESLISYNSVTPGVDMNNNYLTSRSFILTLGLEF